MMADPAIVSSRPSYGKKHPGTLYLAMISIVIPVYNESGIIGQLINHLKEQGGSILGEIIVSDGGSIDGTVLAAQAAGALTVISPKKGRAAQMNHGASLATGNILYFVHADTFPPDRFGEDIQNAVANGYGCGRFRTKFDSRMGILGFNAFFTRFDLFVCYGGDQTFFIQKDIFKKIHGFRDDMYIMEDYDIVTRAKKVARYKIIQKDVLVSARKYESNGWLQVQKANLKIIGMYKKGSSQQEMVDTYKKLLRHP